MIRFFFSLYLLVLSLNFPYSLLSCLRLWRGSSYHTWLSVLLLIQTLQVSLLYTLHILNHNLFGFFYLLLQFISVISLILEVKGVSSLILWRDALPLMILLWLKRLQGWRLLLLNAPWTLLRFIISERSWYNFRLV